MDKVSEAGRLSSELATQACSERVSGRAITHLECSGCPVGDDVIVMANSVQNSVKMCRLKVIVVPIVLISLVDSAVLCTD